ncbi:hypothetical protein OG394_22280 [Kribbella sp. NBC_01245]|uniref:hypothetical protein n=1 Tax=Kribbella sp. NBC_01245 TaxID=2903578 RepID=UPI002E2BC6CF|nr:hypothetical protein [Kribbella sp. NBC_01245]
MTPTKNEWPASATGQQTSDGNGATGVARDEAGHLKEAAAEKTAQVAGTAKEQVGEVASELREQTARLASQTREQLQTQAVEQRDRLADGLRSISSELRSMAQHEGDSGWVTQLAKQGSQLTDQAAQFLADREPGQVLDECRNFARRRPGVFLLGAAVAGMAAGRLTKGLMADRRHQHAADDPDQQAGGQYEQGGGQYQQDDVGLSAAMGGQPPASGAATMTPVPPAPVPDPTLDPGYGTDGDTLPGPGPQPGR